MFVADAGRRGASRWLGLALALSCWLGGADPAVATPETRVYRPVGRSAEELAPIAAGILGPGGSAIPDRGSGALVLRGEPEALSQTLEALSQLDRPLRSFRIESTITTLRELRRIGAEVGGWTEAGELRFGRLAGSSLAETRLRIRSVHAEGSTRFEGVVTALEGTRAEIWTGTTYPERVQTLHELAGRLRVYETTTLVPVQTGFEVRPRGLGNGEIELDIAPLVAERVPPGESDTPGIEPIVHAGVTSRIRVRPDELAVIGTIQNAGASLSIDPFATLDLREGTHDTVLLVQVSPLK